MTIELKCRSTSFAFDGKTFRQWLVTECGQHFVVEYTPTQIALIGKQATVHVCDRLVPTSVPI